jgi:drug/metabolite transporter (DMT)-like permease
MLISGCSNSLLTKFQDNQCVGNCDAPDNKDRSYFAQPVFQTAQMFVAEGLCWLIYLGTKQTRKSEESSSSEYIPVSGTGDSEPPISPKLHGKKLLLLSIPACFDICGTTLMNVGLFLIPVSIFQMTRGAVVLFVGLFSTVFLKHVITVKQWMGLFTVSCGVFLVGLSAALNGSSQVGSNDTSQETSWEVVVGILLILVGQVFTASQFVVEEFILEKYSLEPIKVVAWEGTFGTIVTVVGSLFIYSLFGGMRGASVFDLGQGFMQVVNNKSLIISSMTIMLSLATFNFCGLSVTRCLSATSRSTIDTCRTLGIWAVSLMIGWESFRFLQLVGFGLLVYGTLLFNGLVGQKQDAVDPLPNEFEHS